MLPDILLEKSTLCRLCCEENTNGVNLYGTEDSPEQVFYLINRYLPLKVKDGDCYPRTICPGCHIQLEATKLFMDLIVEGQAKLRGLLSVQQELFKREAKEKHKLEQVLQNHNPHATVETYTIQTDENGEKYVIQIYSDGPLFAPEHQLALQAEGLEKPKRKRGRPPKTVVVEEETVKKSTAKDEVVQVLSNTTQPDPISSQGLRQKRTIKPPARYEDTVQGSELTKVLKKEGIIDEDLEPEVTKRTKEDRTLVGKIITDGEITKSEPIFMKTMGKIKRKNYSKPKFYCDICNKEFQHQGRCQMHQKSHRLKYGCRDDGCTMESENKQVIMEHQNETGHVGLSVYEPINNLDGTLVLDDIITKVSTTNDDITLLENTSFKCEKCDKTFSCKQSYEVHLKGVHCEERPFKCKVCNKTFAYACSLKKHLLVHQEKGDNSQPMKSYNCDMCDKIFQHLSSFMYHRETEHSKRKFVCNKCNKEFKHRQLLLRHQAVHSDKRPYKCDDCNRQFKSRNNLVSHKNIHKGIKNFVCPVCGNHFLHRTSLFVHLRLHEGFKPYVCNVCSKAFTQKGNLLEHQRIHTGEKPYKCNECGRSFTTSSQYKLHLKLHTGEKPHACTFCPKRFLHKDTFDSHVRRHLNERPFKCVFCAKSFPDQWARTRHQRTHLAVKRYRCDICDKTFSDCSNYSKHKKIHLKNDLQPESIDNSRTEEQSNQMGVELVSSNSEEAAASQQDIQIEDLLSQEGNTISITTADGQQIPIVSSENDKFQGFLPDGTLVSFDILSEDQEKIQEATELPVTSGVDLLNAEMQFIEDNSMSQDASESLANDKPSFLSADGKVCFITAFDENAFLTIG